MVVNMYDQENMTRIMGDHKVLNTYEKKYKMAMTLQEAGECVKELAGSSSGSNRC